MNVTQRKLHRRTGTEGPQHDPYSFEERIVDLNGVEHRLHTGLGTWYRVDGQQRVSPQPVGRAALNDDRERRTIVLWEEATGITVDMFDRCFWRVHPYFEDPMGHPSQYV